MNKIIMIPVEQLHHHPENPRKDLGDLTELAESIRKNGVYQNLTVVKEPDGEMFLVVIGNRRMEAAKAAGLTELPCVVAEMDHKEQIATMLEENMQRQDLTIYEQAQGFQMMMDLGYSPKEIGEKTGFSEKTVKDRIKLTKFNQKNFSEAVGRGATLMDLLEISKLESKADQAAVMEAAGTNNFRQKMLEKLQEQEFRNGGAYLEPILKEMGLLPLPEGAKTWSDYDALYGEEIKADLKETTIRQRLKEKSRENEGKQLFYKLRHMWNEGTARAEIYRAKEKTARELSEEQKTERQRAIARNKRVKKTQEEWAKAYVLRRDFIRNYTVNVAGVGISRIGQIMPKYALNQRVTWGTTFNKQWNKEVILDLLGIQQEDYEDKNQTIWSIIEGRTDIPKIRAVIAWICGGGIFWPDSPEHGEYSTWDGSYEKNSTKDNDLKKLYEFLQEIGYQMSDMETQLMDGTHPVYKGEDGED